MKFHTHTVRGEFLLYIDTELTLMPQQLPRYAGTSILSKFKSEIALFVFATFLHLSVIQDGEAQ